MNREDPWLTRFSSSQENRQRGFNSTREDSEYQRDRARVIHSASFRALQSKTQVLGLGESDFYRTRLTHSLEVAQIGSGICEWLRDRTDDPEKTRWIPSFSLIEAIGLAHDLGHSPFGHGGEVALNFMMREHGGFEGNAQTLRILSKLGEFSKNSGLDLTRRTMLGTIKYPAFYSETVRYERTWAEGQSTHNIKAWSPPKCIYDSEAQVLDWILEPFSPADVQYLRQINQRSKGHHRPVHKTFDTSIMELADDIAYGVHDLEDACALKLVSATSWREQVATFIEGFSDNPIRNELNFYADALFSEVASDRKHAISKLVGYLIKHITIEEHDAAEHPLLRYQATMDPDAMAILKKLKSFVMEQVILSPELQTLQFRGQQVIMYLFGVLIANPRTLLPGAVLNQFNEQQTDAEKMRVIADHIASMTDISAGKLHHRLSSPSAGSIFDRF